MGQKEKDYMHDPATGRKLTARERLDRLRTPFADQTIVDAAPVAAQSLAERQKQRKAADEMAREVAAKVAAKAAENLPPVNPFAARAAELQAKLETVAPHERASYERRLSLFVQEAERWAAERAAEARRASFLADPGIVTMGENAAAIERSHAHLLPDCSADEVAYVLAIAKSDAFATPAEQTAAYWAAARELQERQYAREDERLAAATDKAAGVAADFQQQKSRRDEAAARVAHATKMEGGGNESPSS
jgi:hypothetical protein